MPDSAERPLAELLAAVSERSPAPGAGSAAAWSGALAASLVEMAARFAGAEDAAARASTLRARLLEQGEEELGSYHAVLAAARLDASDPTRSERLDEALSRACDAPLAIARAAADVAELAVWVATRSTHGLEGDAIAGVLLADAACQAAVRLVEINLAGASGDPRVSEATELGGRAQAARERALRP